MQWNIPAQDPEIPEKLLAWGCTPLLAAVLHARGMDDTAEQFLEERGSSMADPMELTDMVPAIERLRQAIAANEHVAVYGDYDVDGITSSCMLADYLRSRGVQCELYIPDRMEEGYGVNEGAVRELHGRGVSLIITVDCGVTTVEETACAMALGVDMIITDHHECRETLPSAVAVVDPKRPDCDYSGGELAGVGVAFKLLCALEGDTERVLDRYADLVAVGTIADVMPLTGENRYIVKRGLEKLENAPRPGLRALMAEAGMQDKKLTASTVGYVLAPRLNASGRLGQVESAVQLLLTSSTAEAGKRAMELCRLNRDRQSLEMEIWQQALQMLGDRPPAGPIVLAREDWHQGVIGIVASRLSECFSLPAVMICLDGERGKGSCRSFGGFNLFEALSECAGTLDGFGGHALAAGLTIQRENVPAFRAALTDYYRIHPPTAAPTLDVEMRVNAPELLRMECVEDLDRLEPCGAGNPRPLLCLTGARLVEKTPIGNGKHLRLRLEKFGQLYDAVWFSHTAEDTEARTGDWVDAAFYPQINVFRAHRSVQLLMSGLRLHPSEAGVQILTGDMEQAAAAAGGIKPPVRDDFALVWRALAAQGGRCTEGTAGLNAMLAPAMREEKLCVILRALAELGLLRITQAPGMCFELSVIPNAPKADLAASRLLQALKKQYPQK